MSLFIETIRIENGCIHNLATHNNRLNATRRAVLNSQTELDLASYIHPGTYLSRTRCRVEYREEIEKVEYFPYHIRPVSSLRLLIAEMLDYRYKYADRTDLDNLFSQRADCDDILIIKNNQLTDTSICNIALWNGHRWLTPATPLLKGTQRGNLLANEIIFPAIIYPEELSDFSRIRLFNAMIDFGEIEFDTNKIQL